MIVCSLFHFEERLVIFQSVSVLSQKTKNKRLIFKICKQIWKSVRSLKFSSLKQSSVLNVLCTVIPLLVFETEGSYIFSSVM